MANQASAPAALAAPKKNKAKILVVSLIAVLLIISLTAVAVWFFMGSKEGEAAESNAVAAPVLQRQALYESLDPAFVVNFQAQGRQRYLQASLALMSRDAEGLGQLKAHMPTLRNQLVMLLSSQDFEELYSPLGVELLKQKLTAAVQELAMRELGRPVIEQVLLINFVMQ